MSSSPDLNVEGKKASQKNIHSMLPLKILKADKAKHHCSETQIGNETIREHSDIKFEC